MSDAGPLIALSRVDLLSVLRELFTEVVVPTAVVDELRLEEPRPGVEPLAEAIGAHEWLQSMVPTDERPIAGLGVGESAALRLARQLRCPLLVDERRGRIAARNHELTIIGTGRVLIAAKQTKSDR